MIDPEKSLCDGALIAMEWNNVREEGNPGYYWQMLEAMAQHYHIDMNKPFKDLPAEHQELVLHGTKGEKVRIHYHNRDGRQATFDTAFEGVIGNLERRYRETNSEYIREKIQEYMTDRPCPTCQGKRLRPEALAVTVDGVNILQITEWPVLRSLEWAKQLAGSKTPLTSRQQAISDRILKEIVSRLGFLVNVGLEYLTLNRSAGSLSGGEAQRIRLATQVGSRLVGVLYVLDEPSIGLHPRDNDRLLTTLKGLRDIGNTVLVVEHDDDTIRTADWVIDLGPGAGEHGGQDHRRRHARTDHCPSQVADRCIPFRSQACPGAEETACRQWKNTDRCWGTCQQPEKYHCQYPAGQVRLHHRCLRVGQILPDERCAL